MAGQKIRKKREREKDLRPISGGASPAWWAPTMVTLMIIGLLWVVTFYLTSQAYPIPDAGMWNLGVGFGLIILGFLMTSRWK